jgi:hypothetical protein
MTVLTFLEASNGVRLSKTFTPHIKRSYPKVKKFHSHVYHTTLDETGLRQMHSLMVEHSRRGHAMLRGQLEKVLINEPRAGLTQKRLVNDTITIDIDGFDLDKASVRGDLPKIPADGVISRAYIMSVSEFLVSLLPEQFKDISYIATASSSTGLKPGSLSMHLDFMLTNPVHPASLKLYLTKLNFDAPQLCKQLTLQSSGTQLKFVCDRTVAENSKLIYIAPPVFQGLKNPMSDKNRIILVEKEEATVDLLPVMGSLSIEQVEQLCVEQVKKLRKANGLPAKTPRMQYISAGGKNIEVLTNPDRCLMSMAYATDDFCYANLQRKDGKMGDSNAYWWPKENPQIVYNFKSEPPFRMRDVDPDFYEEVCKQFANEISLFNAPIAHVFRDIGSDEHYSLTYDTKNDLIMRMDTTRKGNLKDFMANHGEILPEPIPDMDMVFNPLSKKQMDIDAGVVNTFKPTKYLRHEKEKKLYGIKLEYGQAYQLKEDCPTLYNILYHMVGTSDREFEHFFNWFAYAYQTREKLTTAWVLTGIEGTGKGLFFHHIVHPLYGNHAAYKTLENIEERFNDYVENTLFMVVDEFKVTDSPSSTRMMNKLKHMVTETFSTVRGMHKAQKQVPLYMNMIFNSNEIDVVRISATDRRFNIGKRQEIPILAVHPTIIDDLKNNRDKELLKLVEFINAFESDAVQAYQPLDNEAKYMMRDASMSWIDHFVNAIKTSDLDYFVEKILAVDAAQALDVNLQMNADRIVKNWVSQYPKETAVSTQELHTICNAIEFGAFSKEKFAKMLSKRGLKVERIRGDDGTRKRGLLRRFKLTEYTREELIQHHFSNVDREVLCTTQERESLH